MMGVNSFSGQLAVNVSDTTQGTVTSCNHVTMRVLMLSIGTRKSGQGVVELIVLLSWLQSQHQQRVATGICAQLHSPTE